MSIAERFWSRVEKTPSCWLWHGPTRRGYGRFGISAGNSRSAHRFAYEALRGPIPRALTIDHLCRVKNCVNPDHMEAVTARENILRGYGPPALNARKETCHRGHGLTDKSGGTRFCSQCQRVSAAAYKQRQLDAGKCRECGHPRGAGGTRTMCSSCRQRKHQRSSSGCS